MEVIPGNMDQLHTGCFVCKLTFPVESSLKSKAVQSEQLHSNVWRSRGGEVCGSIVDEDL